MSISDSNEAPDQTRKLDVRIRRSLLNGLVKLANRPRDLLAVFIGTLLTSSWLYSTVEGKAYFDSVWWAVVTSFTVGYGDLYPTTTSGRYIAIFLMAVMIMVIQPLITATIAAKMIVDSDAFTHLEQEQMKQQLQKTINVGEAQIALGNQLLERLGAALDKLEKIYDEVDQSEELAAAEIASTEDLAEAVSRIEERLGELATKVDGIDTTTQSISERIAA